MTRAVVIINPLSGSGRRDPEIDQHTVLARTILGQHAIDATVRQTTGAGDARAFAREAVAAGCPLVVAWGGDGTVNEVASSLVYTETALGIVPAGSGNGLASDLAVPFDPAAALEMAATGRTVEIDAGQVNDCLFFNIAGVGIDAVVAARFAERGLRRRGPLAYAQLSTIELMRYQAQTYTLTIDGRAYEHRAMLVAIANGRQYGNRLLIAPGARLDDGRLEVVIVEPHSLLKIAWRLPSLFRGTLRKGWGIDMRSACTLRVQTTGAIPFHVDGEPRLGQDELAVLTHPRALRVKAPPNASVRPEA
jgi:YegS/Rv2252/BmrU family lipid kinase